jgi:hypothetical protein
MFVFAPWHRLEDLNREVTVMPLPTPEETEAALASIAPGQRVGPAMAMLFGTPAGRQFGGYKASLVARVQLRLGMWRWSITPPEVSTFFLTACLQLRLCMCGHARGFRVPLIYP